MRLQDNVNVFMLQVKLKINQDKTSGQKDGERQGTWCRIRTTTFLYYVLNKKIAKPAVESGLLQGAKLKWDRKENQKKGNRLEGESTLITY